MEKQIITQFEVNFDREWNKACRMFGKKHDNRFQTEKRPRRILSEFEEQLLIEMYRNGCSYEIMAEKLKTDTEFIINKVYYMFKSGKMEKLGVERR